MQLSPSSHVDTFTRENLPPHEQWPVLDFVLPGLTVNGQCNAAGELIDRAVELFGPHRPCLLTPQGEHWTYGQLLKRSNQVAQVLTEDVGLVPGNRVLLRSPNNPWLVACWLGVLKAGGVVVTTMHTLRTSEVRQIFESTRPMISIADHRFLADLQLAVGDEARILSFGSNTADGLFASCRSKSGQYINVETAADDVAILAPTSGTTGIPKITMHFHRDILAIADTFGQHVIAPQADDIFSGTPPLAFTFGLGGLLIFPLRFGASSLLIERAAPAELAELCHMHRVTIVFTAPTAYRAILRNGQAFLLQGVRKAVASGEHLPIETWRQFHAATGIKLINALGATEMLHAFAAAADDEIRPGAIGRAVPGFRAKVLNERGDEARLGEPGRLAIMGPTGCRYLYGDKQLDYVGDGWNVTGDFVRQDPEGYLWYEARSDNIIVSSGFNISAPEVEGALAKHPDILEVAVTGKPNSERGNIVCAYVVLHAGCAGDAAKRKELQEFVKAAIAPYKYPREVVFVKGLPRSPSGKLQHYRL